MTTSGRVNQLVSWMEGNRPHIPGDLRERFGIFRMFFPWGQSRTESSFLNLCTLRPCLSSPRRTWSDWQGSGPSSPCQNMTYLGRVYRGRSNSFEGTLLTTDDRFRCHQFQASSLDSWHSSLVQSAQHARDEHRLKVGILCCRDVPLPCEFWFLLD